MTTLLQFLVCFCFSGWLLLVRHFSYTNLVRDPYLVLVGSIKLKNLEIETYVSQDYFAPILNSWEEKSHDRKRELFGFLEKYFSNPHKN
jgi:hypothetical protein